MEIRNGAVVLKPGSELVAHIKGLIPDAKSGVVAGEAAVAVKHDLERSLVLRNLGFDVPSPINYGGFRYCGMYPPRDNQKHTAAFATLYRRAFVLNEMRTGKSGASLWASEYLIQEGFIRRVLIVCPKSCTKIVWEKALFEILPHRSVSILVGSKDQRVKQFNKDTDFRIINHDGITALAEYHEDKKRKWWEHPTLAGQFDLIIYDEADVLCNHRTDLYQAFSALVTPTTWLWLMTGTPTPTQYWDAWGLLKLVCSKMPAPSWTQFRERLGVKVSQYKWVNKTGAKELLYEYMQPAIRFTQKQCFDLPKVQIITRSAELTKEQKALYWQMQKSGAIERGEGESRIIAANAAVKVMKMLQISCGSARDEFGDKVSITPTGRLGVLGELLHELSVLPAKHPEIEWSKKTIVFIPFIYVMEDVKAWLEAKGYRVGLVNGSVPQWKRDQVWGGFKATGIASEFEIIVAHPEVVQYGLDLTVAESEIWYAPCTGVKMYSQACQRIQGETQKQNPCIIHIICTRLEQERYDALVKGGQTQESFLEMYSRALDEQI